MNLNKSISSKTLQLLPLPKGPTGSRGAGDFLVGTLLGDAHIRRTGLYKEKAYLTFEQSSKKAEYINYLLETTKKEGIPLDPSGACGPRGKGNDILKEYSRTDSRYNVTNKSLYFRTQSTDMLSPIANLFLNEEDKKIVPTNISELLTPRSLAF